MLAGPYGAQTTLAALVRRGLRVERTGLPQDFSQIRAETRRMAAVLGVPARGEELLREMDAELAAIPRHPSVRALYLEARGYAAGAGTLEAAVLNAAGFTNAGAGGQPGLEAIAENPPQLLVVPEAPDYPSLATELLRHPALRGIPRRTLPPALLACAGPWTARAAALLGAMIRLLAAGVVVLFAASVLLGPAGFSVPDAFILLQIRLPRAGLAVLVGGGLGLARRSAARRTAQSAGRPRPAGHRRLRGAGGRYCLLLGRGGGVRAGTAAGGVDRCGDRLRPAARHRRTGGVRAVADPRGHRALGHHHGPAGARADAGAEPATRSPRLPSG